MKYKLNTVAFCKLRTLCKIYAKFLLQSFHKLKCSLCSCSWLTTFVFFPTSAGTLLLPRDSERLLWRHRCLQDLQWPGRHHPARQRDSSRLPDGWRREAGKLRGITAWTYSCEINIQLYNTVLLCSSICQDHIVDFVDDLVSWRWQAFLDRGHFPGFHCHV